VPVGRAVLSTPVSAKWRARSARPTTAIRGTAGSDSLIGRPNAPLCLGGEFIDWTVV